jgi:putative ABC transport system permease protein
VVLAAIYLRPGTVPLIDPKIVAQAFADPHAAIAAPLGFGDSLHGSPIAGTVAAFVDHLSGGLQEGRLFATETEAVAGPRPRSRSASAFAPSMDCTRTMTTTGPNITNTRRTSPSSAG